MTEMLLRARNLVKRYGSFVALSDVSFDVSKGEVVAVVGPNGAGKSTLVGTLSGEHDPDDGNVLFEGRSVLTLGPSARAKRGLARSFQLVSVFQTLTVQETMSVGAFSRSRRSYHIDRIWPSCRAEADQVRDVASAFGLEGRLSVRCSALSQGEKKLVDIASALTLRPRLLLLDEPSSGISSADKHAMMRTLLDASKTCGVESLVLVEHDMELIARYATRVIGLRSGAIVADMPTESFFADPDAIASLVGKTNPHA